MLEDYSFCGKAGVLITCEFPKDKSCRIFETVYANLISIVTI
jgi:hypothetical protein